MTTLQEQAEKVVKPSKKKVENVDPVIAILQKHLPKGKNDLLKIAKVAQNSYRVNWLTPTESKGDTVFFTTYHTSNSRYLTVEKNENEYLIIDKTLKVLPLDNISVKLT